MRQIDALRLGLAALLLLFEACSSCNSNHPAGPGNPSAECECLEYPFPKACESKCGMKEFIVKGVDEQSNTAKVAPLNQPSQEQTIPLSALQTGQIRALQAGSHIQVLYKKTGGSQPVIKPLRLNLMKDVPSKMKAVPPK